MNFCSGNFFKIVLLYIWQWLKGAFQFWFILPSSLLTYPNRPTPRPSTHTYSQLEELIISGTSIIHLENLAEMHSFRSNYSKIIWNDFSPYCAQTIQWFSLGFITLFIYNMKYKSDSKVWEIQRLWVIHEINTWTHDAWFPGFIFYWFDFFLRKTET